MKTQSILGAKLSRARRLQDVRAGIAPIPNGLQLAMRDRLHVAADAAGDQAYMRYRRAAPTDSDPGISVQVFIGDSEFELMCGEKDFIRVFSERIARRITSDLVTGGRR